MYRSGGSPRTLDELHTYIASDRRVFGQLDLDVLDYRDVSDDSLKYWREATAIQPHFVISETPRYVGRAVAHLAADPEVARWNGRSLSSGALAKEYGFTDLDGSRPDAWRYLVEVQDAGLPADTTGYR